MAIALVSNVRVSGVSGGTTGAIDTTGASLLNAAVAFVPSSPPTISDSKGNTWTALTNYTSFSVESLQFYYVANPTVGSGHTFTDGGLNTISTANFAAFSGAATVSPFDVENGAINGPSPLQPGSITPSANGEVVLASIADFSGTASVDSGFTITDQAATTGGQYFGCALAYLVQTSAAAVNPTWTVGGGGYTLNIASFKAAAASSAIKTVMGLALASVKTVNGLAIASVKTVNGLA